MGVNNLRPVKWSFDEGEVYDGFTNDTYWNGFLNVRVTAETHKKVLADCDTNLGETGLDEIKPDADGLYDYSCGFATQEVETDGEMILAALDAACASIQAALGVKHGDVAGVFFTGKNYDTFRELMARYIADERADISGGVSG